VVLGDRHRGATLTAAIRFLSSSVVLKPPIDAINLDERSNLCPVKGASDWFAAP
jgi:hypothetical protein